MKRETLTDEELDQLSDEEFVSHHCSTGECMSEQAAAEYGLDTVLCAADWDLERLLRATQMRDDAVIAALIGRAYHDCPEKLAAELADIWGDDRARDVVAEVTDHWPDCKHKDVVRVAFGIN